MRPAIQVKLPEGPPDTYLAWVDWWRNVERVIHRLEVMTSTGRGSGPKLVHGPVAGYISRVMLEEVRRQARHALQCENEAVGPLLRADPALLWDAAGVLEAQARWLDEWLEDGVVTARLGVSFPGWRVELLRGRVVESLREQVRRHLRGDGETGSPTPPARRRGEMVLTLVDTGDPQDALAAHIG